MGTNEEINRREEKNMEVEKVRRRGYIGKLN
jgi:hypothetical protein